ncbi:filament-like plant protein 3 [Cucurbita maxima]|uniref:Filament-like plant protein 3 n=1 Tax=Cucurbita maxima TaxID=3661 RepID=A0A6J1JS98_CUCMA|nr:filament-like plant protein 3 [Cucurbita maxima]XP_022990100.1 filament-like plant protein 3 [Cucurbita maxima]XP_022990101.1 filament-like plant protein 3 [Cucurbita maxima]XP_022990102.1 filament-like plant protein 3 [Cucurbita maxima]
MERRKWPWKRKSSDKSPGETESSGSMSSYSERFSDEQDAVKSSPTHETLSPEVTSKAVCKEDIDDDDDDSPKQEDINDSVKDLTDRLSAALLNVREKEDLVKQHAKVAEEAIAGWEKAESEVGLLKQQLRTTIQQKSALEDRVSHLDGALKECVRQLRQGREEQEQKIRDIVEEKSRDWESTKADLERQLLELQSKADTAQSESPKVDPSLGKILESLKRENAALRHELHAQYRELETRTIERDLSTQTAETASKQHLDSIKKMAKLEAECRRLKVISSRPSLINDHKSIAASTMSIESITDTQSDNGEQLNAVDIDVRRTERNKCEPSCSDSWALALPSNLPSSLELDLMDDFLEMERLAALPETDKGNHHQESEPSARPAAEESAMITELETMRHERSLLEEKLNEMEQAKEELEEKLKQMEMEKNEMEERFEMMEIERDEVNQMLEKMETERSELGQILLKIEQEKVEMGDKLMKLETEKDELETALSQSQNSVELSQSQLKETEMKLENLQTELTIANESKLRIEYQLISMEAESLTMSAKVGMLESDIQKERASALALTVKCQELEEQLSRNKQDEKQSQIEVSKNEMKIKQEDLAVAAGKLADCQKTIASLGDQLKSLAALEDFLIDTTQLPEFAASESHNVTRDGEEQWQHSNGTFSPKRDSNYSKVVDDSSEPSMSKNEDNSPPSSSSSTSSSVIASHVVNSEKNRNGFAKFFSRTKSGIKLEI